MEGISDFFRPPVIAGAAAVVVLGCALHKPTRDKFALAGRLSAVVGRNFLTRKKMCERVVEFVLENSERGNPDSVLSAIDKYARGGDFLINVGPDKGLILDAQVAREDVFTVLELGCFMGYGALRILRQLAAKKAAGKRVRLVSIDPIALWGAVAVRHVHHAGLAADFDLRTGTADKVLPELAKEGLRFDLIFVDHAKECYLADVKSALELGLLKRPGGVVLADNCGFPGCPDYVAWMEAQPGFASRRIDAKVEYSEIPDFMLLSEAKA